MLRIVMAKRTSTPASPAPLVLVPAPAFAPSPPPYKLGKVGRSLWDRIQSEWAIEDSAGLELLAQAALAADRVGALAARIAADGEVIETATGLRAHPCLKDELGARAFIVHTLQRLGLTDEAIKPVGRPSRRFGDAD
jgi:hypothetical protein